MSCQAGTGREATERAEASEVDDQLSYRMMEEDRNGLTNIKRYESSEDDTQRVSLSQGSTRGLTRDRGRFTPRPEPDRFWSKVNQTEHGCWLWTAAVSSDGYGRFRITRHGKASHVWAHRWAYEHAHGPIPEGWEIDHLCRTRACVRPDHLEAVTARENKRRARQHHR